MTQVKKIRTSKVKQIRVVAEFEDGALMGVKVQDTQDLLNADKMMPVLQDLFNAIVEYEQDTDAKKLVSK